ncbi:M1 family metallopeptidase [Cytophagales bacterium LB-30]|uniref:M1 family metallopeptidase n=1 Tax=Shiella aurantiaca TaxID=3058365 RepID=A0ABT8F8R7_9BACT|nr:M1 family metallopeptidase [Shiella aurantiaca]MDN4166872.1 M1 family metallopeptidase [Shiella aurantiaca]
MKTTLLTVLSLLMMHAGFSQTYFQQEVDYQIAVRLDDQKHQLHAFATIEYTNNSPDELSFIYFHLWPNAYKNEETALAQQFLRTGSDRFAFSADSLKGYIDSLDFKAEGQALRWEYDAKYIDVAKVYFNQPLKPQQSIRITTPFRVQIPGEFSRLGHVGQGYQITQWYPKPAVYDAKGWHPIPYLDMGEFYSEFGSFEVKITLPKNYKVAATGVLQEEAEKQWLMEQVAATEALKEYPSDKSFPPSSLEFKTLTFVQDSIHDFAWFADKRYLVSKSQVKLESGKKVDSWAFYLGSKAHLWNKATMYIDSALYYYSKWVGDYPYSHATAVQGALLAGGGMEYPMITVISAGSSDFELDQVVTHEVGHNWFYGILGSNERDHAWMDEGFNSFVENRYMLTRYPKATFENVVGKVKPMQWAHIPSTPYHRFHALLGILPASYGKQEVVNTSSNDLSSMNYGLLSYHRTSTLLTYLKAYLGEETFDRCMHTYFERWKFKHPSPQDVQKVFEEVSGKNLSWFFGDLFNSLDQIDYALQKVEKKGDSYAIRVKNGGDIASPFVVDVVKGDVSIAQHWFDGHEGVKEYSIPYAEADRLVINYAYDIPEIRLENNSYETKGLLPRLEPLSMNLLTGISNHSQKKIYFLPAIGANTEDQFLLGAALHNLDVQGARFNYFLAPMYSFGRQELAGNALLKYDFLGKSTTFNKVRLMGQAKRFAGFTKLSPSLTGFFGNKRLHYLQMQYNYVEQNSLATQLNSYQWLSAHYQLYKKNALVQHQIDAEWNAGLANSPFQTLELGYSYKRKLSSKASLSTHWFGGLMLQDEVNNGFFNFYTASSPDYGMNYYMTDRVQSGDWGWFGNSLLLNDQGRMKAVNVGAQDYLLSTSWEYERTGKNWGAFADAALVDGEAYYDAGLFLKAGFIKVYLPALSNAYTQQTPDSFKEWANSIRFSATINTEQVWNNLDKLID